MVKLIALDLDGTTLNKEGVISEETERLWNRLQSVG